MLLESNTGKDVRVPSVTSKSRTFLFVGSLFGFLGVALGAFAAHGLRNVLSADMIGVFETAVRYQMYHAFAILAVAATMMHAGGSRLLNAAGWFFAAGILVFSGSLYVLTMTGIGILGAVTPIGGVCFLVGWACLGLAALARG